MNIYVLTCDKYNFLMPGFAYLFNKYYGGNYDVTVACFAPPQPLPDNFHILPIAKEEEGAWTGVVRPFFEQAPDYFMLLLDDYWLIDFVSHKYISWLEIEIKNGAAKADINGNSRREMFESYKPGYLLNNQTSKYRSNLQPAIWTKQYFLSMLRPGRTIWEFERIGQREAINDGAKIVALNLPQNEPVYRYANIYKKGQPSPRHIANIPITDRKVLCEMGYNTLFKD